MLKTRINSLRKELQKLNAGKDQKVYIAFASEKMDKAVIQHHGNTVFEGTYSEYEQWINKRIGRGSVVINDDIYVKMAWELKGIEE